MLFIALKSGQSNEWIRKDVIEALYNSIFHPSKECQQLPSFSPFSFNDEFHLILFKMNRIRWIGKDLSFKRKIFIDENYGEGPRLLIQCISPRHGFSTVRLLYYSDWASSLPVQGTSHRKTTKFNANNDVDNTNLCDVVLHALHLHPTLCAFTHVFFDFITQPQSIWHFT